MQTHYVQATDCDCNSVRRSFHSDLKVVTALSLGAPNSLWTLVSSYNNIFFNLTEIILIILYYIILYYIILYIILYYSEYNFFDVCKVVLPAVKHLICWKYNSRGLVFPTVLGYQLSNTFICHLSIHV